MLGRQQSLDAFDYVTERLCCHLFHGEATAQEAGAPEAGTLPWALREGRQVGWTKHVGISGHEQGGDGSADRS